MSVSSNFIQICRWDFLCRFSPVTIFRDDKPIFSIRNFANKYEENSQQLTGKESNKSNRNPSTFAFRIAFRNRTTDSRKSMLHKKRKLIRRWSVDHFAWRWMRLFLLRCHILVLKRVNEDLQTLMGIDAEHLAVPHKLKHFNFPSILLHLAQHRMMPPHGE
jgi:hypothetical protein